MMDTDVCLGSLRADRDGTVSRAVRVTYISGVVGLTGVTGREWAMYQTKTAGGR